jgi:hypothetical protein
MTLAKAILNLPPFFYIFKLEVHYVDLQHIANKIEIILWQQH